MSKNLPLCNCPNCNHRLDGCTSAAAEQVVPKPNDFTICLYCKAVLKFNKDLTLVEVTADEIAEMDLVALGQAQAIAAKVTIPTDT